MNKDTYESFLNDLVVEAIELTKDPGIYGDDSFNSGYRAALYTSLHLIETQLDAFGIDRKAAGFGAFNADEWLRSGKGYWLARGLPQ